MIKDKSNWGDFLERLLTAAMLTFLIVSCQQALPKFQLSLSHHQTTFLAQRFLQSL